MRRGLGLVLWIGAVLAPGVAGAQTASVDDLFRFSYDDYYRIRGQYLVNIVYNCGYCHTPLTKDGQLDRSRFLAGHAADAGTAGGVNTAFDTPWGRVFAPNITPDRETGIGNWDRETFVRAVTTGIHGKDAPERWIYQPMPWLSIRNLPRDDLEAIWAFLRAVPPVKNKAPAPLPKASSSQK